ncbi:WG repeat-containing protein [Heyndrickxia sporothermodurans]
MNNDKGKIVIKPVYEYIDNFSKWTGLRYKEGQCWLS